ncbi:MAG: ABC-2 transporter permease [Clostridia bacterium]
MLGLMIKDILVILKTFQMVTLFGLLPPFIVALQNHSYFMPILAIVIPVIFASQISMTMGQDEMAHWRKNVTAMPISIEAEAGSKYLLLIVLSGLSMLVLFLASFAASLFYPLGFDTVLLFSLLGFLYALLYGLIIIPASFRYGTSSSKYVFMLFIFLPTMIPVLLHSLGVALDFTSFLSINNSVLFLLLFLVGLALCAISYRITVHVLKKHAYAP